ncbi:MAG TPA: HAD family hydrolase [Saliniramus sp.]|nr:HAD family hydrolase [Saliniramus sp.]
MKPLALFDLDGTLVDTPLAIGQTFAATFAELGLPRVEAADIRATIGMPLGNAFGRLMGLSPEDAGVVEAVLRYQALSKEILLPQARGLVLPGVVDGLARLASRGIVLAVATSKVQASAEALLEAAGLAGFFASVVGADRVPRPKPYPDSGLLAMDLAGAAPETTVMVGDTTHDLLMAHAAGMRSVAVTYGVHARDVLATAVPSFIVDGFPEAAEIIESALDAGYARDLASDSLDPAMGR